MKKILITGANGYIQTFLKKKLKHKNKIKTLGKDIKNDYIIDLSNTKKVNNFFSKLKFDCIIHCAANVPGKKNKIFSRKSYLINHLFTENIVKNHKTSIIFISSTKVYNKFARIGYPFPIQVNKLIDYASSKILSENLIINKVNKHLILRVPSVIGPNVKNGLLYKTINKKFILKKIPEDNWCIISIQHLLKPIESFIKGKLSNGIYNIGYDVDYSFSNILNYTYKLKNIKHKIKTTKKFKLFLDKKFQINKKYFFKDLKNYILNIK